MQTFDRVGIKEESKALLSRYRSICVLMFLYIVVAEAVLASISLGFLSFVLSGLITVTAAFFFIACWREKPVRVGEAISNTFDAGFLRKLGGMLWMQLKVFLWSFLFILPGIIKYYSYILTDYVLADCQNVRSTDACRLSEKMMHGHRAEYFLMELSFSGWMLLSAMTFGILYVVYVGPYIQLTKAGIYEELKQIALETGAVTQAELDGQAFI